MKLDEGSHGPPVVSYRVHIVQNHEHSNKFALTRTQLVARVLENKSSFLTFISLPLFSRIFRIHIDIY